jgi:general secretion pathway protein J
VAARHRRAPSRGFTLVEVLVALVIMAVLAGMAWSGIDGMARSRTASNESVEKTLRLNTALAQWEQDLLALQNTLFVDPIDFDGATLRVTREAEGGVQLVAWSLRGGAWWRWASPAVTQVNELQEYWLRSQQLLGNEPGTLKVIEDAADLQIYFFRGNGWSNAQSAGDVAAPAAVPASGAALAAAPVEQVPSGVRLVLAVGGKTLTRDTVLAPQLP